MPTSIYGFPVVTTMSSGGGSGGGVQRNVVVSGGRSSKNVVDASSIANYDFQDEKIPLFLMKLWKIMEDPTFYNVVCWDETGFSFHIVDPYTFCRDVLPQFFKHNNLNSLIRQLNMYGFRKITPLERSGLHRAESDHEHLEFSHPYFVKGHPELLSHIKRKTGQASRIVASSTLASSSGSEGGVGGSGQELVVAHRHLQQVLDEVRQLREKQLSVDKKLQRLTKENEAIWQEFGVMRSHHMKQQTVVNKLIQFLATMVQPTGHKRLGKRQLLAIGPEELGGHAKRFRPNSNLSNMAAETLEMLQRELRSDTPSSMETRSNGDASTSGSFGPIIADVTDEVTNHGQQQQRYATTAQLPLQHHHAPPTTSAGEYWYATPTTTVGGLSYVNTSTPSPDSFVVHTPPATPSVRATAPDVGRHDPMLGVGVNGSPNGEYDFTSVTLHPDLQKHDFTDFLSSVDLNLDSVKDSLNLSGNLDQDAINELFSLCEQTPLPPSAGGSLTTLPPMPAIVPTTTAADHNGASSGALHYGQIRGDEVAVYQPPYTDALSTVYHRPSTAAPTLTAVSSNSGGYVGGDFDEFDGTFGNFVAPPHSSLIEHREPQILSPTSISLFDPVDSMSSHAVTGSSTLNTPQVLPSDLRADAYSWPPVTTSNN